MTAGRAAGAKQGQKRTGQGGDRARQGRAARAEHAGARQVQNRTGQGEIGQGRAGQHRQSMLGQGRTRQGSLLLAYLHAVQRPGLSGLSTSCESSQKTQANCEKMLTSPARSCSTQWQNYQASHYQQQAYRLPPITSLINSSRTDDRLELSFLTAATHRHSCTGGLHLTAQQGIRGSHPAPACHNA